MRKSAVKLGNFQILSVKCRCSNEYKRYQHIET